MTTYTNDYSQVILANQKDSKGRTIVYQVSMWELEDGGKGYGQVQKGTLKSGEFIQFGVGQKGKEYNSFGLACRSTNRIARERIANL
tara:strand:- start:475 stop:735 length:261 start_codon:yes stop_codon:yes gene_type:complete